MKQRFDEYTLAELVRNASEEELNHLKKLLKISPEAVTAVDVASIRPELKELAQTINDCLSAISVGTSKKKLCMADSAARELMLSVAEALDKKCLYTRGIDFTDSTIKKMRHFSDTALFTEFNEAMRSINGFKTKLAQQEASSEKNELLYDAGILAREFFHAIQSQLRKAYDIRDPEARVGFVLTAGSVRAYWNDTITNERITGNIRETSGIISR